MVREQDWRQMVPGPGFESCWRHFASQLWQFPFPDFAFLSEETLKAVCSFYLVSMPGKVKYATQTQGVMGVHV